MVCHMPPRDILVHLIDYRIGLLLNMNSIASQHLLQPTVITVKGRLCSDNHYSCIFALVFCRPLCKVKLINGGTDCEWQKPVASSPLQAWTIRRGWEGGHCLCNWNHCLDTPTFLSFLSDSTFFPPIFPPPSLSVSLLH